MNKAPSQLTAQACEMTDEELARQAAEVATDWVSADTPLSQDQGWHLVGLQYAGSAQGEMHTRDRVGAWRQQLVQALKAADGSAEGAGRIATARSEAVAQMRDMLLDGIRSAEQLNKTWISPTDPRAALRAFISRHQ
ncbi:hypothetical protein [Streptomyces sp. NBC_01334]|uniref:hypothetical protein n=1 Tax=Streptomyces sp. NBC_01334 TaxID=2903827 RepID=UPI002E125277|nr:hypothetical protein OG736_42095 [Streptomyces sp. NBC_01334]